MKIQHVHGNFKIYVIKLFSKLLSRIIFLFFKILCPNVDSKTNDILISRATHAPWKADKGYQIYAEKVKSEISKFYSGKIEIRKIITTGDQNQNERLSSVGGKGMFSTNIEKELLENKIDIAVHALKDMPSADTIGLITNCFLKRKDSWLIGQI